MAQQTTLDEWAKDPVVDPEVRAHVYSLVNALGGAGEDGTYQLGDDALLVLKDLRKWLKFADQQLNRRDVARCMAEANLVKGDLLEILAKVSEKLDYDKLKHKIAVACLELLVPLTWPFEIDPIEATINHHRHGPYLELAQIGYKRAILQFDRARILQTAVRIALPSMATDIRERTPRDEGIIRIALYFLRNVAMMSPPSSVPMDIDEAEVSRSTTIDTFHEQDIFQVLLSVASSIGDEYVHQDVVILEILFYVLKGIDAEKLFMEDKKLSSRNTDELRHLMQKEKSMHASYTRNAPTRHNRFGTMVWVKRDEDKVSTLSGQGFLGKHDATMQKLDKSKKWDKPKFRGRKKNDLERENDEFDLPVHLSASAQKHLKAFVEEFLDSSFNPLFAHLRKAIERETDRVEHRHSRQFFYLISWFLRAECSRRRTIKERATDPKSPAVLTAEDESYGLVAEVMNQETFILLNKFMETSKEEKGWQDLNAGMKCFTHILLTVQEMSESALEEDQEIADNIQNRIFYEESTHDRVIGTLRSYKEQGFGYLDACTELGHVFLRMLERYSKQNVDLQIRSKNRARNIRKKQAQDTGTVDDEDGHVSDTADITAAQRTLKERKFDFDRFASRFVNQSSVDTFVQFTKYYRELNAEQLKRAHRFFYRVAFKMDVSVLLYRVDIIALFNKMIRGPDGLDPELPVFKEWEELIRHFFRAVVKKVQSQPVLIVEMLFSKLPGDVYYLEHGQDREMPTRTLRAPAELEVKGDLKKPEQIGVAVGVLIDQHKSDALRWVRDVLKDAAEERKAWEDMESARKEQEAARKQAEGESNIEGEVVSSTEEAEAPKAPSILVKPDTPERRIAMFKDNKLRLLMTLVGFLRLGEKDDTEASWVVPSSLTSEMLLEAIDLIRKHEFAPPVYDDGKTAKDFLRSAAVSARRTERLERRAEFDDDSSGDADNVPEEDLGEYALGRPEPTRTNDHGKKRKKLTRRRHEHTPQELDAEEVDRRTAARREKELEKQRKVKSTMFVHDSDDESDEDADAEFFKREEVLRLRMQRTTTTLAKSAIVAEKSMGSSKKRKERKGGDDDDEEENEESEQEKEAKKRRKTPPKPKRKPKRKAGPFDDETDEDESDKSDKEDEDEEEVVEVSSSASSEAGNDSGEVASEKEASDIPLSSQHPFASAKVQDAVMANAEDDDEEDDVPVVRRPATARNVRAGFIIDSDSE